MEIFIPAPVAESYEVIVNDERIQEWSTNGLGGVIYPLPKNKKMHEGFLMETVSLFAKHEYDASRIIEWQKRISDIDRILIVVADLDAVITAALTPFLGACRASVSLNLNIEILDDEKSRVVPESPLDKISDYENSITWH